jgi:hypothetical protein
MLKANVGLADRLARTVVGIALMCLAVGLITPGSGWNWLGWIGVVPLLTAVFGNCPLYTVLGVSTRGGAKQPG